MRHRIPTTTSYYRTPHRCYCAEPAFSSYINSYNSGYMQKHINMSQRTAQILQYVADHDGCKRVEINCAIFYPEYLNNITPAISYRLRSEHCIVYSQLLYLDLIDYDKSYRYHITEKGRKLLKCAYINETIKNTFNIK